MLKVKLQKKMSKVDNDEIGSTIWLSVKRTTKKIWLPCLFLTYNKYKTDIEDKYHAYFTPTHILWMLVVFMPTCLWGDIGFQSIGRLWSSASPSTK